MTAMLAMVALAAATWVLRVMFILVVPAARLPQGIHDGLGHLAPAVLASVVVVELVDATADLSVSLAALVLASMALAAAVVCLTRRPSLAVAVGLATALALDLVLL